MNYKKALEKEELFKQEMQAKQQQLNSTENTDAGSSLKCPVLHNGNHENETKDLTNGDNNCENKDEINENVEGNSDTVLNENQTTEQPPKPTGLGTLTTPKIETVTENLKAQSLTDQQINDYCKSLFIFKNIRVMRFK